MIFVTFIDILMPSNSMKKYIKMILGLLVMTIILQPVLGFINKDFNLSGYTFKFQNQMESSYLKNQNESESYSQKQQDAMSKLYKQNLETQMAEQINKILNGGSAQVSVDVVDDMKADNYGDIKKVMVTIDKQAKAVEKVEKVTIGSKETQQPKTKPANNNDPLITKISAMYGIDSSIIVINYVS